MQIILIAMEDNTPPFPMPLLKEDMRHGDVPIFIYYFQKEKWG